MVTDNNSFEGQLMKLITEAKNDLEIKEGQRKTLENEIETLRTEMHAFEVALRSFQKRSGKQEQPELDWAALLSEGKTHKERVVIAMRQIGGVTRPNHLTDILYNAGFIKSKRRSNAYQIVQRELTELVDKDVVEKLDTGEYRLIGAQATLSALDLFDK